MNIFKVLLLTVLLTIIVVGCNPYKKPQVGFPPVSADAAVFADAAASDMAAVVDTTTEQDLSGDIISESADLLASSDVMPANDVANPVDVPLIPDAQAIPDSVPNRPAIHPIPGWYAARLIPDGTDAGTNSISSLDRIGLTVRVDAATGVVSIFYFAAMDTNGIIPVADGKFDFTHGKGGTDGTVCPANGYSINGVFISPTEIEGDFVSRSFCSYNNSGHYIATLVPPVDSGVAPDTAAPTEAGAPIDAKTIDR